jgi:hypothetical protein
VLSALSDESWRQLDLSGCSRLFAADMIAVAGRMPNLQVLDVSGESVVNQSVNRTLLLLQEVWWCRHCCDVLHSPLTV